MIGNSWREQWITALGIVCTLVAATLLAHELWQVFLAAMAREDFREAGSMVLFWMLTGYLIYGSLAYQLTRYGYFTRLHEHIPTPWEELAGLYRVSPPRLTILVPSYKEEESIVRQTLYAAALQEYGPKELILLIDDPPAPRDSAERTALLATRHLPDEVTQVLAPMRNRVKEAREAFQQRADGRPDLGQEARALARMYEEIAAWFEQLAVRYPVTTHTDRWFVKLVCQDPAAKYRERARRWAAKHESSLQREQLAVGYRHLSAMFDVTVSSFERKRYLSLSHEPNKAMNLNSYLSLMGKHVKENRTAQGVSLYEGRPEDGEGWTVPDADYVITLDADSLLVSDYAAHLIHYMEQPDHARVAVIQTPYSAVPDAPAELERCAGATTDIQYFVHQGFTRYGATFWVGANALLRKSALNDIATTEMRAGISIVRYIQDHTVIEDTESTVDLVLAGWRLHNYPARLAYSATPSDFGSLVIQRGRWANGGLLILPKLLRYFARTRSSAETIAEAFCRFQYLTSLAAANLALLIILCFPFSSGFSMWLPLSALPYYALYARDLRQAGYRRIADVFRVYALNLLLLPVHLGGVLKSLQQAWTGQKIPFQRTPKIIGRTRAPGSCVCWEYLFVAFCIFSAAKDFYSRRPVAGTFALANAMILLYAIHRFIGFRESWEDLLAWPALQRWRQEATDLWARGTRSLPVAWRVVPALSLALCLLGQPVHGVDTSSHEAATPVEVAVTFDDLPAHGELLPGFTRLSILDRIISVLTHRRIKAVGFVNGSHLDSKPGDIALLERWAGAGLQLGNHTYHHRDFSQTSINEFLADIEAAEELLDPLLPNGSDKIFFRYPYLHEGETVEKRAAVRRYLTSQRYVIAPVTVNYQDWAWTDAYSRCIRARQYESAERLRTEVVSEALQQLHRSRQKAQLLVGRDVPQILLVHVGVFDSLTIDAVLDAFTRAGVRFIPLAGALEDPIYQIDPGVPVDDQITFFDQLLIQQGRPSENAEARAIIAGLHGQCQAIK